MSYVGRSVPRVDARDKAAGRAMYAADLCDRRALTAKILHAEKAHALVKRIDAEKARAMDGVEAVFTASMPKNYFRTVATWSTEPEHQDVADSAAHDHVRLGQRSPYRRRTSLWRRPCGIEVEYEPPFVPDVQKAMEPGAPQLHEAFPWNVPGHSREDGRLRGGHQGRGSSRSKAGTIRPTSSATSKITTGGSWRGRCVGRHPTQIPRIVRCIVGQAWHSLGAHHQGS
ncbi:MAG: hypothetical protein ACLUEK_06880 [Oscillospiraceae bacterium]